MSETDMLLKAYRDSLEVSFWKYHPSYLPFYCQRFFDGLFNALGCDCPKRLVPLVLMRSEVLPFKEGVKLVSLMNLYKLPFCEYRPLNQILNALRVLFNRNAPFIGFTVEPKIPKEDSLFESTLEFLQQEGLSEIAGIERDISCVYILNYFCSFLGRPPFLGETVLQNGFTAESIEHDFALSLKFWGEVRDLDYMERPYLDDSIKEPITKFVTLLLDW